MYSICNMGSDRAAEEVGGVPVECIQSNSVVLNQESLSSLMWPAAFEWFGPLICDFLSYVLCVFGWERWL